MGLSALLLLWSLAGGLRFGDFFAPSNFPLGSQLCAKFLLYLIRLYFSFFFSRPSVSFCLLQTALGAGAFCFFAHAFIVVHSMDNSRWCTFEWRISGPSFVTKQLVVSPGGNGTDRGAVC